MLGKNYKLNSVQFKIVFDNGRTIHSNVLAIKYLTGQDDFRAAAVVSKKHTKTAVLRNYKRRIIYNILKNLQNQDTVPPNTHLIIILKKTGLNQTPSVLEQEIKSIIKKIPGA